MNKFQLVKAGMPCYISTPFKLESIMQLMERNEKYIFWIQPPGTTMQKQIACVQINDVFYQLNLRLEKAIFRENENTNQKQGLSKYPHHFKHL